MIDMTPDDNEAEGPYWLGFLIPFLVVIGLTAAALQWLL